MGNLIYRSPLEMCGRSKTGNIASRREPVRRAGSFEAFKSNDLRAFGF